MTAAGAAYRATPDSVKVGGGVAVLALVGLVLWVLWGAVQGAKKVGDQAGRAAGDIATGIANATSGLPELGAGVGGTVELVGSVLNPFDAPSLIQDQPLEKYQPRLPTLKLMGFIEKGSAFFGFAQEWLVSVQVVDRATGVPVPAMVYAQADNDTVSRLTQGVREWRYLPVPPLVIRLTQPFFLTNAALQLIARAPGFNDSDTLDVFTAYQTGRSITVDGRKRVLVGA